MSEETTTAAASTVPANRGPRTNWFSTRNVSDVEKTTLGSDKIEGDVVLTMPEQQKPPDPVGFIELFRYAAAPSHNTMPPLTFAPVSPQNANSP